MNDIDKKFDAIDRFENEIAHGLVHTEEYKQRIQIFRKECQEWRAVEDIRIKNLPLYDSDNHVSSCGCVVENGKCITWCGDHF